MTTFKPAVYATLLLSSVLAVPQRANAWAYYWSKVEVKTSSWSTCMSFADGEIRKQNLTQIQHTNLDVSGRQGPNLATITCVGTGGNANAVAVVMVVGDADASVKQLRDALVSGITRVQNID